MKIWFDITNTPQVHFLLAVRDMLLSEGLDFSPIYTARDFSETKTMLSRAVGGDNVISVGSHYGKSYLKKVFGLLSRYKGVSDLHLDYDFSISCGSENAIWYSYFNKKHSIAFGDNDQARQWTYAPFVDYAFFPTAIDRKLLERQGLKRKLYQYHGYKENIYLAHYSPDPLFLDSLPFSNYVVVRPENVMANYIRNGKVESITPGLLNLLSSKGINVLYLPRYATDREYSSGLNNVYVPDTPINGLDACYYADAVLTGAGTFAREAACLGVPSFSFYAGKDILSVDKQMIKDGKMYFSRNSDDLVNHMLSSSKNTPDLTSSKIVYKEVSDKLLDIINNL